MKITEIEFGKRKVYVDENKMVWKVGEKDVWRNDSTQEDICECYHLKELLNVNFEEQVDWSKVEVDTPILGSFDNVKWEHAHFESFSEGKIYAYGNGKTSWSCKDNDAYLAKGYLYAKLGDVK
jgi:hypothetical protein